MLAARSIIFDFAHGILCGSLTTSLQNITKLRILCQSYVSAAISHEINLSAPKTRPVADDAYQFIREIPKRSTSRWFKSSDETIYLRLRWQYETLPAFRLGFYR